MSAKRKIKRFRRDGFDEPNKSIAEQKLISVCHELHSKPVKPDQRLSYLRFLRELLWARPNQNTTNHFSPETILLETPLETSLLKTIALETIDLVIASCQVLDDWPMLAYCCRLYQKRCAYILSDPKDQAQCQAQLINKLHLLNQAYQQQGLFDQAESCLKQGLLKHHRNKALLEDYKRLRELKKILPQGLTKLRSDELILTPLQRDHEKDFLWQYADPSIAELCTLPDFNDEDENDKDKENWQQWLLECQRRPEAHLFAVQHIHWGFVGSVNIDVFKGVGFFYYWFGKDFQGRSFGPQAARILIDWSAGHLGLNCCYTKVYQDNIYSQKALEKSGFRPLPLKIAESYEQEAYEQEYIYYRGNNKPDTILLADINQFFTDMDCGLEAVSVIF